MPTLMIEIGHAGHVHFYKNIIDMLEAKGWKVILCARQKPHVDSILEETAFKYYDLGRDNSNLRKIVNLMPRIGRLFKIARLNDADLLTGVHPIHAANVSLISGIPCIGFADTDHAIEQILLYGPGCDRIYTPKYFSFNLGRKHRKYAGFHELAYLHPKYFTPQVDIVKDYGLLDNGPPIVIRLIEWDATHDLQVRNRSPTDKIIKNLSKKHPIVISAEGEMPTHLEKYRNPMPESLFHHLLAFSQLYIGPGATTASESAILGTPAIYTNQLSLGYIDALEERGLVFHRTNDEEILFTAKRILEEPMGVFEYQREQLIRASCDVTELAVKALQEYSEM